MTKTKKPSKPSKSSKSANGTKSVDNAVVTAVHRLGAALKGFAVTCSTTFGDVTVPDALRSVLPTGWDEIDAMFAGEGIRPSTCCLLTGLPGAGKTTVALQLADKLASLGHVVVFNSCEESLYQLKMNVERMGLKDINKVHPGCFSEVGEILAHAEKVRAKSATKLSGKTPNGTAVGFFLIIDSLQTIEKAKEEGTRGRNLSQQNQAVEATWDIASWCKDFMTVGIIIGQVTKDGEFAGKQEIKHAVDCHLHLGLEKDKDSDFFGNRKAEMTKNRFGATGIGFYYEVSSKGISFTGQE